MKVVRACDNERRTRRAPGRGTSVVHEIVVRRAAIVQRLADEGSVGTMMLA
jgi:hypothetical protein